MKTKSPVFRIKGWLNIKRSRRRAMDSSWIVSMWATVSHILCNRRSVWWSSALPSRIESSREIIGGTCAVGSPSSTFSLRFAGHHFLHNDDPHPRMLPLAARCKDGHISMAPRLLRQTSPSIGIVGMAHVVRKTNAGYNDWLPFISWCRHATS